MKKYQFLAERYYKFFKYLRTIGLISMIVFLVVTAFNRNNSTLSIIQLFCYIIDFSLSFGMCDFICFIFNIET